MLLQLLEEQVFLRSDEKFWDPTMISEAIRNSRSGRLISRILDHRLHEEMAVI